METARERIIKRVLRWANAMIGMEYSKEYRYDWFKKGKTDCSGYVYAMYLAGLFPLRGIESMTSMYEVYAQGFDLKFPDSYDHIGKSGYWAPKGFYKTFAWEPGDIIFYCRDKNTDRKNMITHVSCCDNPSQIIHTRQPGENACLADISYGDGSIVAVIRLKADAAEYPVPIIGQTTASEMDVRIMQAWLNFNSAELRCDGDWGPKTSAALAAFQSKAGISGDGTAINKTTWNMLLGEESAHLPGEPQKPAPKLKRLLKMTYTVNTSNTKLQKTPNGETVSRISKGAVVTYIFKNGDYMRVLYAGQIGYIHRRYLSRNDYMRGDDVKALQRALGFSEKDCDGIFGTLTASAVAKRQGELGLKVDAIVGPITWAALFPGA